MLPFYEFFPKDPFIIYKVSDKNPFDVPEGEYLFFDLYCSSLDCACKGGRAELYSVSSKQIEKTNKLDLAKPLAVLLFEWDCGENKVWKFSLENSCKKTKKTLGFLGFFQTLFYENPSFGEKIKNRRAKFKAFLKDKQDEQERKENFNEYMYESGDKKIGRNDQCPCGSGKKHKKCCGR